mmetsp:Transcript_20485/g.32783  ORF Transcript_20485/g.32783 Transcript_20485/m.32783 type:complete len:181 (+) Transcript_20485:1-543(+)
MVTSTDDLVAALQPPLNAAVSNRDFVDEEKHVPVATASGEHDHDNIDHIMSTSHIAALAKIQTQRDQKVREFQERLRRLQELLNKSEQEHKRKDSELHYLRDRFAQIQQAQDVKRSADNTEYLKNALLQYFDGTISVNQLVSVAAVGLHFSDEEQKKAQNSKLMHGNEGIIGGYVKSWWG